MASGSCCATRVWHSLRGRQVHFSSCTLHDSSSASSANTSVQAVQASAFATSAASWFFLSRRGTTAEEQQAGIWCVTALHLDLTRPKTLHADCNIEPVRCLAPGYSRLSCCNRTGQPSSAGPDISLLRPELQRSGIMPKISSWETGRSQPAAVCVCGGVVTSVRVGFRTNGWPLSATGRISTPNAPFAPTTICANTTPC